MSKLQNIHVYGSATVGERGQVVIPKKARKDCSISSGDTLMVIGNSSSGITFIKAENLEELSKYVSLSTDGDASE